MALSRRKARAVGLRLSFAIARALTSFWDTRYLTLEGLASASAPPMVCQMLPGTVHTGDHPCGLWRRVRIHGLVWRSRG